MADLSQDQMLGAIKSIAPEKFCTACFDGNFPIKVPKKRGKYVFERQKIRFYDQKNKR